MTEAALQPFVNEGLGNSSYVLRVGRHEAVVVDPDRSATRYVRAAESRGLQIVAVVESHLHADFVSGGLELHAAVGAQIHAPAEAGLAYPHRGLREGDRVEVGDAELEVRATPGHAPEHLSFVLRGEGAAPPLLWSGGALIVGGAARTDLVAPELTDPLTRALFATRRAFDDLPDETVVLPTHGAGSFCSAGSGSARTSTLGAERLTNPVLTFAGDEDAFARWFPSTFPGTPAYYSRMRTVNAAGPRLARDIASPPPLYPLAFEAASRETGALVVDCRAPDAYSAAHIGGALAIPFRPAFSTWLGWLAPEDARLLLVVDGGAIDEVVVACLLVGYERFAGYLEGGFDAWVAAELPVRTLPSVEAEDAVPWIENGARPLDVREPDEFEEGRIRGATQIALGDLPDRLGELPGDRPLLVYCASGYRSVTGASILERFGAGPVVNLRRGYGAWRDAARD